MTTELTMLCWSVVLGLLQIAIAATGATVQRGTAWAAGARDNSPPLSGVVARLDRASSNFLETFPFFLAVVLAAHLLGRHSHATVLGAELYFWARVAYVPIYASGVAYVRTLIWTVSIVGIVMVLSALF